MGWADIWEQFLLLLFPHKCFLCGRVLAGDVWLCSACELPAVGQKEVCPRCAKPVKQCICRRLHPAFSGAAAPLYYTDGVRRGIHHFKYGGRRYYASFLAQQMAGVLHARFPDGLPFDLITFVPMHPKKQRARGYCQSELLACELAKCENLPVQAGLLRHTGNKKAQMEQKGWEARLQNAKRSFELDTPQVLDGMRILLIDDVLTTCATAQRCAYLLLSQGAKEVFVLAAATTSKKNLDHSFSTVYKDAKDDV